MKNLYQIYLISDSTGETLDRIFLALKAQFPNFEYETKSFLFYKNRKSNFKYFETSKKREKIQ